MFLFVVNEKARIRIDGPNLIFMKNNYDMIPIEFSNYELKMNKLLENLYLCDPLKTISKITFDTHGITHEFMDSLILTLTFL